MSRPKDNATIKLRIIIMYLIVCLCYSFDLELVAGEHESSDKASTPTGEEQLPEYSKELDDVTKSETGEMDGAGGREVSGSEDMINIPSPIPELDELIQNDDDKVCEDGRESCMSLSNIQCLAVEHGGKAILVYVRGLRLLQYCLYNIIL